MKTVRNTIIWAVTLYLLTLPVIFTISFAGYDPRPWTFEILLFLAAFACARLSTENDQ